MEVIYTSQSYDNVCEVERRLIQRFHMDECASAGFYHNDRAGGAGRVPESGPYYVYVISAPAYTRLR